MTDLYWTLSMCSKIFIVQNAWINENLSLILDFRFNNYFCKSNLEVKLAGEVYVNNGSTPLSIDALLLVWGPSQMWPSYTRVTWCEYFIWCSPLCAGAFSDVTQIRTDKWRTDQLIEYGCSVKWRTDYYNNHWCPDSSSATLYWSLISSLASVERAAILLVRAYPLVTCRWQLSTGHCSAAHYVFSSTVCLS